MHKTALYDAHVKLGAKMVPFGGWMMPLQYTSILAEHKINREQCSIFDCSHMGEFFIQGSLESSGLDQIVTQKLEDMPINSCRYGVMLNESGGVIDDLIVYKMREDYWGLVVNAANIEKDRAHIQKNLTAEATFEDASLRIAKLDIQGPRSREVLKSMIPCVNNMDYYCFESCEVLGQEAIVSRTGYTGELGFEIYYPWDQVGSLWDTLLSDDRVKPTGLGVRDVLRIEMCYPLYGHELSETILPLDAGLKRFIDFDKKFIGQTSLLKYDQFKNQRQSVCLLSDSRRAPREGFIVLDQSKKEIGVVTSGSFSPSLGAGIAMALVRRDVVNLHDRLYCDDGKKLIEVTVVKRPFYQNGSLKK